MSERETTGGAAAPQASDELSRAPVVSAEVDEAQLAAWKLRGFVFTGEIFAALGDLEPETAELAAIYDGIRARGVDVIDEIAEELQREDARRGGRWP